jgi:hypothetical protein
MKKGEQINFCSPLFLLARHGSYSKNLILSSTVSVLVVEKP